MRRFCPAWNVVRSWPGSEREARCRLSLEYRNRRFLIRMASRYEAKKKAAPDKGRQSRKEMIDLSFKILPQGNDKRHEFSDVQRGVMLRSAYDPETREWHLDRLNGGLRVDEGSAELNEYRDRLLREQVLAALDCELGGETARLWLELGSVSHISGHSEMIQLARAFQESLKEPFMVADKFGNLVDTRDEELKVCHIYELHRYLSRLVRQIQVLHAPVARRKSRIAVVARYFLCGRPTSRTRAPRSARRASFSMAAASPGGGDSSGDPDSGDPPGPHLPCPFLTPLSNNKHDQEPSRPWLGLGSFRMERGRSA